MRGKSHKTLGIFLANTYLAQAPGRYIRAFLLGCVEPDRNPATYLKGSLRWEFLRGHNYENALRYMTRIARRLERKGTWNILDYYAMGKLIHYTADAFTYAHNACFQAGLSDHRVYEQALQTHFLGYIASRPALPTSVYRSVMDAIRSNHRDYCTQPPGIHTDARYAFHACCCVLAVLILQ